MSLNFNSNISAIRIANRLNSHYSNLTRSVERLSSGVKLNSSADSPVDMATHNILEGKTAVYNSGLKNLQEAISLTQTADSAINEIGENLIRMKEIAEQVASGTYTNEQRMILQSEFAIMSIEIDRIASFTDFKGTRLLDGSLSTRNDITRMGSWYQTVNNKLQEQDVNQENNGLKIHFGDGNNKSEDFYFLKLDDLRMSGLLKEYMPNAGNNGKIAVSTQESAQKSLEALNTAIAKKNKAQIYAGIFQNRLSSTMEHLEDHVYQVKQLDSIISDVDYAQEMTNFMSFQMLSESATTMLSQANVLPKIALKLLNN